MNQEQAKGPGPVFWPSTLMAGLGVLAFGAVIALGIFWRPDTAQAVAYAEYRLLRTTFSGAGYTLLGLAVLTLDLRLGRPLGKRHVMGAVITGLASGLPAISAWLELVSARLTESLTASFGAARIPPHLLDRVWELEDAAFIIDSVGIIALLVGVAFYLKIVLSAQTSGNPNRLWLRETGRRGSAG